MRNFISLKALCLLVGVLAISVSCGKGGGGGGGGGDGGAGSEAVSGEESEEQSGGAKDGELSVTKKENGEETKEEPALKPVEGITRGAPVDCAGVTIDPGSIALSYSVAGFPGQAKILFQNGSKYTTSVSLKQITYLTIGSDTVISTDIPKTFSLVRDGQRTGIVTYSAPQSGISSPALVIFGFECSSFQLGMLRKDALGGTSIMRFVDVPVSAAWWQ